MLEQEFNFNENDKYRVLASNNEEYWDIEEYFETYMNAYSYWNEARRNHKDCVLEQLIRNKDGYVVSSENIVEQYEYQCEEPYKEPKDYDLVIELKGN